MIKKLLKSVLLQPQHKSRLSKIKKDIYKTVTEFEVTALKSEEPIPKTELEGKSFQPIKHNEIWADRFGCCWFKLTADVPVYNENKHYVAIIRLGGEGEVYYEGEPIGAVTSILNVSDAFQAKVGKQVVELPKTAYGKKADFYVDAGNNGINGNFVFKPRFKTAVIAEVDDLRLSYYYDYLTLFFLLATKDDNEFLTRQGIKKIERLTSTSYGLYKQGDVEGARAIFAEYLNQKTGYLATEYTLVGQAHLDLAWLWPKRESIRKAIRIFTHAINKIETYPTYVFGASQAAMFEWIEQREPQLFEKIKTAVKNGNIEIQGGMWTECDCNMPCGESLIRQFLLGERYFLSRFNKSSKTVWLPDAFGFPQTLPQIIKGVGKKYFMTIKLSWNTFNKFPYQTFYWEAPDGSKVLTHIAPEGVYNSDASPMSLIKAEKLNVQKNVGKALLIYGAGDGGGGPGEASLEFIKRENIQGLPRSKEGSAGSFFDSLVKKSGLPNYKGELYLEKHQGTLTSQSENKRLNRFVERELHTLEWLLAISGGDQSVCEDIWKVLLFNQFHDILPGSGIGRVHKESQAELSQALDAVIALRKSCLDKFQDGENGLFAINPSPFARNERINCGLNSYSLQCNGYSSCALKPVEITDLKVCDSRLENKFLTIEFDKNGEIKYLYHKEKGLELSEKGLNRLVVFPDKRMFYNAWDIDINYLKKKPASLKLVSRKTYIDGSYAVMENTYIYGKSKLLQKVLLESEAKKVVFETKVHWQEKHKMLRALFYPTIYSEKAEFDIQFGSISRSTATIKPIEKARFEVAAHKYCAVKNEMGIFAVISESKYGYRAKDGVISLNLLRSPKYPDKECDMGEHVFKYEIALPDNKECLVAEGYNFNQPILIAENDPQIKAPVCFDRANIIIETIKPIENAIDGASQIEGFVIRAYERFGKDSLARLTVNIPYKKTYSCDLLENNKEEGTEFYLFKPHQIRTIIVEL